MKKQLIMLMVALVSSSAAFAQFGRGGFLVGGSVGGSYTTTSYSGPNSGDSKFRTSTISFAPKAGYFVANNFAVGLSLDLETSTQKYVSSDAKRTVTAIGFGPFARYYAYHGLYVQGAFNVGSAKENDNFDGDNSSKGSFTGFNFGLGYAIMLNDYVAIEPQIGYASLTTKQDGQSDKNILAGPTIQVGFQIYLPTK